MLDRAGDRSLPPQGRCLLRRIGHQRPRAGPDQPRNAWPCRKSFAWQTAPSDLGASGKLTRGNGPQTSGDVERFLEMPYRIRRRQAITVAGPYSTLVATARAEAGTRLSLA
jgi:hypothetical protein